MEEDLKEVPSGVPAGPWYPCSVDYCRTGIQFCNLLERRCAYCRDYFQTCFTNLQVANCTQYCMDQWTQNKELKLAEEHALDDTCMYQTAFFISLVMHVLYILIAVTLIICIYKPKLRQWLCLKISFFKNNAVACPFCGNSSRYGTVPYKCNNLQSANGLTENNISFEERHTGDGWTGARYTSNETDNRPNNRPITQAIQPTVSPNENASYNRSSHGTVQASSPNTTPKEPVTPATSLTKAKTSKFIPVMKGRIRPVIGGINEVDPLLGELDNEVSEMNNIMKLNDDSDTRAKRINNGSLDRPLGNELSNISSSGYDALPHPPFVLSADTGYSTDITGQYIR